MNYNITYSNSNSTVQYMDGNEQVWPCRCGQVHRGDYGQYDYGHHECFHDSGLVHLDDNDPNYLACPDCGKTFHIRIN